MFVIRPDVTRRIFESKFTFPVLLQYIGLMLGILVLVTLIVSFKKSDFFKISLILGALLLIIQLISLSYIS